MGKPRIDIMKKIEDFFKNKRLKEYEEENKESIPDFRPGDTVRVHYSFKEKVETRKKGKIEVIERERMQIFEGVVIAIRGGGLNKTFTVRKMSFGTGIERIFPFYSPKIKKIEIVKRGKVRRGKLYYLREKKGKEARIKERIEVKKK